MFGYQTPTFRGNLLSSPISHKIQHHTTEVRSSVSLLLMVLYLYTYHAVTHFLVGKNGLIPDSLQRAHVNKESMRCLSNKTNRRINSPNLFLSRNSTCFGQFPCSSSGVSHCTFGTGICHAVLMTVFKHNQDGTEFHPGRA